MSLGHGSSIVRDGLVLHLDAANPKSYPGSGSAVFDLSTFKTNSIIYQATFSDNYFDFDGTDDNIYISSLATNAPQIRNITNIVSGELFFYPYSTGGDSGPALIRCGLGTDLTFGFFFDRPNRRFFFHWYDTTFRISYSNINIINLDSWNCGCFVRDGSSVSFYINGNHVNTNTGLSNPTPTPSNLGIGAARSGTSVGSTGQDMAGRISSVKIYNRALSETEVKQNFEALRGRYGI